MTGQTGEHLTTSRITRLLRPLRAKCLRLASYSPDGLAQSSTRPIVTYGNTSRQGTSGNVSTSDAPLTIIPPPEKLSALSKVDRASRRKVELSRRIHDVRDTFRNLVQTALQSTTIPCRKSPLRTGQGVTSPQRGLAALCAMRVGEHIEDQVQIAVEERADADLDDEEQLKVVECLYEAIYPQYRKYTVISHALSIILSICSSDHTLLTILLDVTIAYNLLPESRLILHHILICASEPLDANFQCSVTLPISHPAHSRYLTQLLDSLHQPHCGSMIGEATFMNIVSATLSELPPNHQLEFWTCKAAVRLARLLRSRNYTVYLSMCSSVAVFLSSHSGLASRRQEKCSELEDGLESIAERLGKWLSHACQHLYDLSSFTDPESQAKISITLDILMCANAHQLHRLHWSADAEVLTDSIASLALMCMASSISATLPPAALDSCHSILRGLEPRPGRFEILVAVTAPQIPEDRDLSLKNISSSTIPALQKWACVARDHSYHLLESSLWSSALNFIEGLTPEIGSHYDPAFHHSAFLAELERLRYEIVRRVEEAERRCFNERGELQVLSTQTPRKGTLANGEWRWEDMVGCWVQKTPVCAAHMLPAKKRRSAIEGVPPAAKCPRRETASAGPSVRIAASNPRRSSVGRAASVSSAATSSTTIIEPRGSPISHFRPPRRFSTLPSTDISQASTPRNEQENARPPRLPSGKPASSRRQSNFTSILRDAQMNRVVLHSDRLDSEDSVWLRDSADVMKGSLAVSQSNLSEDVADADPDTAHDPFTAEHPSSDDVLDLFAYRSSDW